MTDPPGRNADYRICTPLPRVGEVDDVANLVMFCSAMWPVESPGKSSTSAGQMLRRGLNFSAMLELVFGADGLCGVV
ncbi:hypothetical protein ABFA25_00315 [Mycobacterium lepromatosis]|nr:hypothetical protein [Mycobacterium lepromatosis]